MRTTLPITISTIIAWLMISGVAHAQAPLVNQLIAQGDIADRAFKPDHALLDYLPAEKLDPNNVPLLLRIARQYRHSLSDAKTDRMKLKLGNLALGYALRAAKLAPNDSEAQLSPAITYGKMLPFQTKQQQYDESSLIKSAADKALKLDPLNDNAWHVLGRWHQGLASLSPVKRAIGSVLYGKLPASTYEEAIACFEKAIAINPKRLRHHIELGKTYALMGKPAAARRYLEKGIAMPETEKDDAEMKAQGRAVLATLPKGP
jgi:tetratricopeptide (TPR) repeat protein